MSISSLAAALLYLGGLAAVVWGLRALLSRPWSPHPELRPDFELRRASRIERIEAARARGLRVVNGRDDGPDAA